VRHGVPFRWFVPTKGKRYPKVRPQPPFHLGQAAVPPHLFLVANSQIFQEVRTFAIHEKEIRD
jgi:hypothetical protein